MFTGIIQGIAQVVTIDKKQNFQTHIIRLPRRYDARIILGCISGA